jgi:hypothetical protein
MFFLLSFHVQALLRPALYPPTSSRYRASVINDIFANNFRVCDVCAGFCRCRSLSNAQVALQDSRVGPEVVRGPRPNNAPLFDDNVPISQSKQWADVLIYN